MGCAAVRLTLADFVGTWRLARQIADCRAGVSGVLSGHAMWQVRPDGGLIQRETGQLRFGDAAPMRADRVYHWRQIGERFVVSFDDGRPFHDFSQAAPAARHNCPPDLYDVAYDFSDWPRWRSIWTVTGPRKDLVIESHFRPDQ
ncbi:MAG: DUF6314 family protein [Pseudomonadota bacterium]